MNLKHQYYVPNFLDKHDIVVRNLLYRAINQQKVISMKILNQKYYLLNECLLK